METPSCRNCRHWRHQPGLSKEEDTGHCHLNPPVYVGGNHMDPVAWFFPVTYMIDYCSRHEFPAPKDLPS